MKNRYKTYLFCVILPYRRPRCPGLPLRPRRSYLDVSWPVSYERPSCVGAVLPSLNPQAIGVVHAPSVLLMVHATLSSSLGASWHLSTSRCRRRCCCRRRRRHRRQRCSARGSVFRSRYASRLARVSRNGGIEEECELTGLTKGLGLCFPWLFPDKVIRMIL